MECVLQTLPSPAGPAQHAESLKGMRGVAITLAERAGRGDHTGEVCHWADGYHLNVRLYEKLLMSVFDILDEGQLVEVLRSANIISSSKMRYIICFEDPKKCKCCHLFEGL